MHRKAEKTMGRMMKKGRASSRTLKPAEEKYLMAMKALRR
jgi:hypothetical protein